VGCSPVVALDQPSAIRVAVGSKVAALAAAARADLPVLPGFVLTTAFAADVERVR